MLVKTKVYRRALATVERSCGMSQMILGLFSSKVTAGGANTAGYAAGACFVDYAGLE